MSLAHAPDDSIADTLGPARLFMPFQYIAIEGPIGVGKSLLAERIAGRLDATAVLEETDNPFLTDFYAGRPGAARR